MADDGMGISVGFNARTDPTRDGIFRAADASLEKFFERPIVAATYTWTPLQGSPFTAIFNPWSLYFGNPRVINRINNYAQMRANLHVRFMINGNGFYYGRLMADYAPLSANDQVSDYSTLISQNAIQASQRMKVFIDPSDCCTNELYLPFVWHADAITPTTGEWASLGQVYVRELNGLKHANAATQPITITVMIWASDVMLSVPTTYDSTALVPQAGEDEYAHTGPVSNTASAIASAAKALVTLPVIGPYARATQLAAGGAAKLAGMMGFSRPPEIAPLTGMRTTYVSSLAPGDAGDNVQKLTVDSKQELTVDPSIIGIDLPDELSVAGIAARESYLTSFTWATTKVAGDLLWNARVNPMLNQKVASVYYFPACAFATIPFEYWRGKMRFRFQIVASAYHKGRLRLVWDPLYVQTLESNIQYTDIIDISTQRDVTVEVDWGQSRHYLPVISASVGSGSHTTAAIGTADASSNGVLGVYVFNDLATPNSTINNDIQINVFVSMVDQQVAAPVDFTGFTNSYSATVQAGEEDTAMETGNEPGCGSATSMITMGSAVGDSNEFAVYFGERVSSFRELLHRYNFYGSLATNNATPTAPALWKVVLPQVPIPYGYNSFSWHTTTVGAKKFNYVSTTLLQYLMPAFACVRGSQRAKFVVGASSADAITAVSALRVATGALTLGGVPTTLPVTSQSNYGRATLANRSNLNVGGALTPSGKQPVLEVEFPYQKAVRFDEARIVDVSSTAATSPYLVKFSLNTLLSATNVPVTLDYYTSIGEDFQLFWFQGCPPLTALGPPA